MKTLLSTLCLFLMFSHCSTQDATKGYANLLGTLRPLLQNYGNVNQSAVDLAAPMLKQISNVLDIQKIFQALGTVNNRGNQIDASATYNVSCVDNSTEALMSATSQQLNTTGQNASHQLCGKMVPPSTPAPIPSKCTNDSNSIIPSIFTKTWARQMLDAAGKPPAGLLKYQLSWVGDYEECVGVKADEFNGQYCRLTIWIAGLKNPLTQKNDVTANLGVCLPDSCTEEEHTTIMRSAVSRLSNNQLYVTQANCQEPDRPYDTRAKIVLGVIGGFVAIMIVATAYDVIICHCFRSRNQRRNYEKDNMENEQSRAVKTNTNENHSGVEFEPEHKDTAAIDISKIDTIQANQQRKKMGDTVSPEHIYKPGIPGQLLLSFSVYTNAPKILSTRQGAGTLTAVNGIRFISMTWVILGHTYAFGFIFRGIGNLGTIYPELIARKSFMAIINAEVSVDTFFTLSGTLLTFLVLKQLKKGKGKLNWLMFYFHRFWRLTPPYMLVMMVYIALFPYLGSGPAWPKDGTEVNYCKDSWWYNLLYINNFRSSTKECFAWAWYLANDMQFYVISPIIILPLFFSKLAGIIVTTLFLLGTTIAAGVITIHYDIGVSTFGKNAGDYFDEYYQRPYCRMGPYLVGMYTGYLLYKTNCKYKLSVYKNLLLWGVFAFLACIVLYGVYDDFNGRKMSDDMAALYNALHKTVWGASISWVIFACATGNGGFINSFLSWKLFIPLGRLTYCAYLVHPIIQYYYYASRKQLLFWDDHQIIYDFLGHMGLAYGAAFIASLAFESPMMGLEKVIFKRGEKK